MKVERVLLVDSDASRAGELAFVLESSHGFRVQQAATATAVAESLSLAPVDGLVLSASLGESDAIEILPLLGEPRPDSPSVLILADPHEHGLRQLAWAAGVTAVLTRPLDTSELAVALKAALRMRQEKIDGAAARERLSASMQRLTDLVVMMHDAVVPGAARRGAEVGNLAALLARGFDLSPAMIVEMRQAALLREVGELASGRGSFAAATAHAVGQTALATARLLGDVPCLQELADLIEGIGANWDGSGVPAGRQRGEIPLRSRLLRVAVDLHTAIERQRRGELAPFRVAAQSLLGESGRFYDPAVVAVLEAVLADEEAPNYQEQVVWVHLDALVEGVVLAADLLTVSGVKLLAAGTRLSATTLLSLRHRHRSDPLTLPITVTRNSLPASSPSIRRRSLIG